MVEVYRQSKCKGVPFTQFSCSGFLIQPNRDMYSFVKVIL